MKTKAIKWFLGWMYNLSMILAFLLLFLDILGFYFDAIRIKFPWTMYFVMVAFLALFGQRVVDMVREKNKFFVANYLFTTGLIGFIAIVSVIYVILHLYSRILGPWYFIVYLILISITTLVYMFHSSISLRMIDRNIMYEYYKKSHKSYCKLIKTLTNSKYGKLLSKKRK